MDAYSLVPVNVTQQRMTLQQCNGNEQAGNEQAGPRSTVFEIEWQLPHDAAEVERSGTYSNRAEKLSLAVPAQTSIKSRLPIAH